MLKKLILTSAAIIAGFALLDVFSSAPTAPLFVVLIILIVFQSVLGEVLIRRRGGLVEGGNYAVHWLWLGPVVVAIGLGALYLIPG